MHTYLKWCKVAIASLDNSIHGMRHRKCMRPIMVWHVPVVLFHGKGELKEVVHVKPGNS